jgi:SAM-dependent methyltransferase
VAAASSDHAFLDRPWIEPLLRLSPPRLRRGLAVRLLGLSPHYWIYQWSSRYPPGMSRAGVLEGEAARVSASREHLCERVLAPLLRPGMVVLDLGTGPGFLARALSRHVLAVAGTDVSRGAVACARAINPAANLTYLVQEPGRLTGVDDSSIDLVCSFAVLQHLTRERAVAQLREMLRVLRPGGRGLCHVPLEDPDEPLQWLPDRRTGWLDRRLWPSMTYHAREELDRLLSEAGCTDVEVCRVSELADVNDDIGREHLVVFRRPGRTPLRGRGMDRRMGRSWAELVRDGVLPLLPAGQPLVVQPAARWPELQGLALFSQLAAPVSVSVALDRPGEETWRLTVELEAGESRFLAGLPSEVGEASELRVQPVGGPEHAFTCFPCGRHLHVLVLPPGSHGELADVARRHALADPGALLGPFQRHEIPSFSDHNSAQRRVYDHLVARSGDGLRRLFDSGDLLPRDRRISRAIHWVWLRSARSSADPESAVRLKEEHLWRMHTWAERNPSFDLHLWTEAGPEELLPDPALERLFRTLFAGRLRWHGAEEIRALLDRERRERVADLIRNVTSVAVRSDLLRLLILQAEGGFYCDLNDTECLVPLDRLCDRFSFVVGIDRYNRVHNAVLGSAPGHSLVREVLEGLETDSEALNRRLAGGNLDGHMAAVLETAGPYALSQAIAGRIGRGELPDSTLLLPFPFFHNPEVRQVTPLSLVHHVGFLSWVGEEKRARDQEDQGNQEDTGS